MFPSPWFRTFGEVIFMTSRWGICFWTAVNSGRFVCWAPFRITARQMPKNKTGFCNQVTLSRRDNVLRQPDRGFSRSDPTPQLKFNYKGSLFKVLMTSHCKADDPRMPVTKKLDGSCLVLNTRRAVYKSMHKGKDMWIPWKRRLKQMSAQLRVVRKSCCLCAKFKNYITWGVREMPSVTMAHYVNSDSR